MRAGRRAHALQEAIDHLEARLAHIQELIDATTAHLADGNLTAEAHERATHRLEQLERLQDHLLDRLAHMSDELQDLLTRWGEPTDGGQGDDGTNQA